jgi:protein disulfide-isomerase
MTRRRVAVLFALTLAAPLAPPAVAAESTGVRFRGIEEGFGEARSSGRPLLLFITADWCAPCHELEREIFHTSLFAPLIEEQFVLFGSSIDAEKTAQRSRRAGSS